MGISWRRSTSWPTLPQLAVLVLVWGSIIVPIMASGTSYDPSLSPISSNPGQVRGQPPPPSTPNTSITPGAGGLQPPPPPAVKQVWNLTVLKASDFRADDVPPKFKLWPENLSYVKLSFSCEAETPPVYSLLNFTYEAKEGVLVSRPYFDVGWVDEQFTPYFKHWWLWQVNYRRLVCPVKCEYGDLQVLYEYRLRHKVLGKGTGYGVAAVVVLQLAVAVCITLMLILPGKVRRELAATDTGPTVGGFLWNWMKGMDWSACTSDWKHLVLLMVHKGPVKIPTRECFGNLSNFPCGCAGKLGDVGKQI